MKATVVNSREDLEKVKTKGVVFVYRPSQMDILRAIEMGIKKIQISPASEKSVGKATRAVMEMKKVELVVGKIHGMRTDRKGSVIEI